MASEANRPADGIGSKVDEQWRRDLGGRWREEVRLVDWEPDGLVAAETKSVAGLGLAISPQRCAGKAAWDAKHAWRGTAGLCGVWTRAGVMEGEQDAPDDAEDGDDESAKDEDGGGQGGGRSTREEATGRLSRAAWANLGCRKQAQSQRSAALTFPSPGA